MSVTIDLPERMEARLEEEARKEGVTVNELIYRAIAEKFAVEPDEQVKALQQIEQWLAEAPTDPDQIAAAEADLNEFQRAINHTRQAAGARLAYPGVE